MDYFGGGAAPSGGCIHQAGSRDSPTRQDLATQPHGFRRLHILCAAAAATLERIWTY